MGVVEYVTTAAASSRVDNMTTSDRHGAAT